MYAKAKKTISHVTPERQLTDEEKKMQVMKILATKREQYAVTILSSLCHEQGKLILDRFDRYRATYDDILVDKDKRKDFILDHFELAGLDGMLMIDVAVKMADYLIEKLFPMKKEEGDED